MHGLNTSVGGLYWQYCTVLCFTIILCRKTLSMYML